MINLFNSETRIQWFASTLNKSSFRVTSSHLNLSETRRNLISVVAVIAYLVSISGFANNVVFLALAASGLFIIWPTLKSQRTLHWVLFTLLIAVMWGSVFNGIVATLRSVTPYFALLVSFALLTHEPNYNYRSRTNGIVILYVAGFIQLAGYILRSISSPDYILFYSLNEFNRFSLGWISIICFFYASLPSRMKEGLPFNLRLLGFVFWLVPVLVILNSSRSELLMTVVLVSISFYMRSKLLFVFMLAVLLVALPFLTNSIFALERTTRSFEEVFTQNISSLSDLYANYRAYENLLLVEKIAANGPIGCGLGCAVPTSITVVLNEKEYDEITVFHNGYLTLILHFGVAGVALIFLLLQQVIKVWKTLSKAYRRGNIHSKAILQVTSLRLGVLLLLLGTGFTTGGFMSSHDTLILLLPLCSALSIKGVRNNI